jgi:hypothetical protein
VLGGFWVLFALALVAVLLRYNHWTDIGTWIAMLLCTTCVATGTAFVLGRTWAQVIMAVLMVAAALFFLDMVLMFSIHGNRPYMYLMMVGVGIACYTFGFILVLAWSPSDGEL